MVLEGLHNYKFYFLLYSYELYKLDIKFVNSYYENKFWTFT